MVSRLSGGINSNKKAVIFIIRESTLKPNFLVIGAPKCATTALCHYLSEHPEVFFSLPKETFFFAYEEEYSKGLDFYEAIFDGVKDEKAIGEGTTVYAQTATFPKMFDRITSYLPKAKIIYMVREPLERIQSHWVEMYSQGLTMEPFNKAVLDDIQYVDASSYYAQYTKYKSFYGAENIQVIFYEDYKKDPSKVLADCFEFLGVDPEFKVQGAEKPRYTSEGKRRDLPITNFLRRKLPGFYHLRNLAPKSIREFVKSSLKAPIGEKPSWDEEVKQTVIDRLQDDTRQFLLEMGKGEDYWPLNRATNSVASPA